MAPSGLLMMWSYVSFKRLLPIGLGFEASVKTRNQSSTRSMLLLL